MDVLTELIGDSPPMASLRRKVRSLLQKQPAMRRLPPILIQGETGTGKGLLARLIHRAGPHSDRAFVDVNCAAIPETLIEAELFGYERGAFTDARQAKPGLFHEADGGTLFLDEIALLPLALQAKLLTVLEQGAVRRLGATRSEPVSVAIVAATNQDLLIATRNGRFREDLYHRLAVLKIAMPTLRERATDIERLATDFLVRACADYGLSLKTLEPSARAALHGYAWPGNVRELHNVIERAALLSESTTITATMLELPDAGPIAEAPPPFETRRSRATRERLEQALLRADRNTTRAAAALDITRATVRARIKRYGLRPAGLAQPGKPGVRTRAAGLATATADAAPEADASRTVGVRWERRRITLLRASIVAADDVSHPAITRVLDDLVDKVRTFGGRVEEVTPRDVVAAFGLDPTEDAPRRAANAALAMLKTVERERGAGRLTPLVDLSLGIHATQGVIACMGSSRELDEETRLNAWKTLDGLAATSRHDIVLSAPAASLLKRYFEVRRVGDGADAVHRLVGRDAHGLGAPATPFVGRGREVEQLLSLLERARKGEGQVASIIGEPGIGKSRLIHELRRLAADEFVVLEGRCVSYGTRVPYLPVMDLLHAVCGIQESDSPARIEEKVTAVLARLGPAGVAGVSYVHGLLSPRESGGVVTEASAHVRARTFEALQQLIVAQQAHGPVLLVVEDLQWIDRTSEELLTSLADLAMGARVLLVATYRPGYQPPWGARSHVSQIALGPLSRAESRRLVASVLPGDAPDPMVNTILTRAEGNPFFLEELARAVREHGARRLTLRSEER